MKSSGVMLVALGLGWAMNAQAQSGPQTIPLTYYPNSQTGAGIRLGINVGITGGPQLPYLLDTGSSMFNATYNPATWGTLGASQNAIPASTVANGIGVKFGYGSGARYYEGNIVQAQQISFPSANGSGPVVLQVGPGGPGFQLTAVGTHADGTPQQFPAYYNNGATVPPVENTFYGTFGAGNFAAQSSLPNPPTPNQYVGGSILGQAIVQGTSPGYIVAANGQTNFSGTANPPSGTLPAQLNTGCSACLVLGLTPQLIGQFKAITLQPGTGTHATFPQAYSNQSPNSAAKYFGGNYVVTLQNGSESFTLTPGGAPGLLDTGTESFALNTQSPSTVPSAIGTNPVNPGTTLNVTGVASGSGTLPTSVSTLSSGGTNFPYAATIGGNLNSETNSYTATLGVSFFMQNSVLFNLANNTMGYTPFFVTDANVNTTTAGSFSITSANVPVGLAGVISGTGGVTVGSGAALQLSATNTYTGVTTTAAASGSLRAGQLLISGPGSIANSAGVINNGIFDISGAESPVGIRDLSGNGQIFLGGQNLTIIHADNAAFSGTIADTGGSYDVAGGSLSLTGGRLKLTGVNTYTGGTTVTGGATLAINADAALGNASGGLTLNNGTLKADDVLAGSFINSARQVTLGTGGGTFDTNNFNVVLGTAVTGVGGLTKNGLGTLQLSDANSYTGGTMVNAGTLQLAPGASLPTTGPLTVNGGTLDFNGNNATVGSLSGLGGTISLGASTLTVAEAGSTSFAGTLTGTGGLTMQGPGSLSLTGANTYTGPTNVTGGRLAVNGSITSNVTVGVGGNLGGSGTITGTVNVLGAAAPGNSIGTLNVVGTFTQAAGSSYQVETNSTGQADRINVAGAPGTATIAGGTVTLTAATGVYAPSTTYTILNATGGVTGTYANANSLYPFLQPSLSYDANNVYLTLRPGGFGAGAATANQAAVGRVLDQSIAGSSGDLATVIGTMATYTQAQGQAAMNAISGQNYSGFGTANLGGGLVFMNALGQQMGLARGGFGGGTRVAVAQACEVSLEACDGESPSPWSLWGSAMGGTGSIAGNANAGTLTYNAGGVATGFDYRINPRFLAGFGVGFSSGNQWASGFSGQGTTNSYQASLYASFTQGAFYLDGLAGYGYNDNQMTRSIVLPNLAARTAQGRTGANQFLGQVEAGYRIGIYEPAALSITPFARFQGTTNNQNGFTESGAGALNLAVAAQTTGSARSVLGAEFAGAFGPEGREKLALQMRLGWAHEYANTARPVTASFAGAPGANFTVFGAAPQADSAILSLAASTAVAQGVSLYARYDGEVGTGTSTHALNGGLRLTW